MSDAASGVRPAAVLVGVQLPGVSDEEFAISLAELGRLVHTLGYEVVGEVTQKRSALAAGRVLGEGKLRELGSLTGGTGVVASMVPARPGGAKGRDEGDDDERDAVADDDEHDAGDDAGAGAGASKAAGRKIALVAVDHDVSPTQLRNLESATDTEVLDRTGVIVEIFHRHAQSREARLQVEIARLNYLAPRLRASATGKDRVRGGVGGKGAGESALELDRRKIRDRIAELRAELAAVSHEQETRRARRREQLRVSLVGYTNAGKSSLMRALTGSEVLVADKLFATLDTTVRALQPETHPRILASDTVGFIKKLPHDLVASFRSTLAEALEASLLLYVVDASDPDHPAQLAVTRQVLREIGAGEVPSRLVLNKSDRLTGGQRADLVREHPDAMLISAKDPSDVAVLREVIVAFFERDMIEVELAVPHGQKGVVGEIHAQTRVLEESWDTSGATFRVRAQPETVARIRALISR